MPARKPAPAVPEFTSDRMRLLQPLITPRVIELATLRLLSLPSFFKGEALAVPDSEAVVKVALIVLAEMNPGEHFDNREEGLRRGLDRKTIGKMRGIGEISA